MAEKFNPSSFSPFLESVKRASAVPAPSPSVPAPIGILKILADAPGYKLDVSSLVSRTALSIDALAGALRELENTGLVTSTSEADQQIVALTTVGESVARLSV